MAKQILQGIIKNSVFAILTFSYSVIINSSVEYNIKD